MFVGPNATLQGADLHDWAFVSMGSTVRHASVESGGLVAAGAVIGDNITVKEGEVTNLVKVDLGWKSRQVPEKPDSRGTLNSKGTH